MLKILLIEDNPDHVELIEDALKSMSDKQVEVCSEATLLTGVKRLREEQFDICFFDLKLPDSTIEQTVELLSNDTFGLPIVILSSLNSIDIAKDLLNQGVQDYLPKDEITPPLLYRTCRYAIERWQHQQSIEAFNQDMQAFCSSLSHDFSGHIVRIKGVSNLLKNELIKRVELSPEESKWFTYLETSTQNIHSLVKDLQHYLSVSHSNKEFFTVDLNEVIKSVIDSLKTANERDFNVDIVGTLPNLHASSALLHLLFHNLLSNAIKFNENTPEITFSSLEKGDYIEISVKDNGIGFALEDKDTIFSPFQRLENNKNYTGSGLGLSIVKRIVEHHEGSMQVESELGKGSCFTVIFKKSL